MTITKEGTLASFYTVNKAPIKHLRVYFSPKQAGEGDPSPSNVREIEGWNGVEVKHTTKSIGELEIGEGPVYTYYMPKELLNIDLVFSLYIDNTKGNNTASIGCAFLDENNQRLTQRATVQGIQAGKSGRWPITITSAPEKTHSILFLVINSPEAISKEPIIEISTPDFYYNLKYELYRGQTHTIDWENDIGTIYGGYVDLVTGELVQTFGSFTVNDNTYINTSTTRPTNWLRINLDQTNNNHAPKILPYTSVTDRGELCNKLEASFQTPQPQDRLVTQFGAYENKVFYNSIYIYNLGVSYPSLTTAEQCVNYIKTLKPTFVYPIATPITYQLTPQQLQTFIGQNNIWSNADRVEVEYDLAESNDELYRRRNQILKASPHLVSVASGNTVDSEVIAHFKTNDTFPLKECIINIQPQQSGSGTPSPDNIREIKGWDNIELTRCGKNLLNVTNSMYTKEGISVTKNINTNGSTTSFSVNGSTTSSNWFENLTYIPNKYNAFFGNFTISTNHPSMPIVIARNSEVYRNNLSLKDASEYTINFSKSLINSTDISTWYRLECWPRDNTTKTVSGEVYPMIRFPDDEGTFEPYNGQTITINLSGGSLWWTIKFINW